MSGKPLDRADVAELLQDPSRAAVAQAAAERVEPGMVVGLGSGRAVWATTELLARRSELEGLQVVTASSVTDRLATSCGFAVGTLDGATMPDVLIDGADEVAPDLGLIKGHGAALLREKLVAVASQRFVVVAEAAKLVSRLGEQRELPVEIVRFACNDTVRRLRQTFEHVAIRMDDAANDPLVTDEGNHLVDIGLPQDVPADQIAQLLSTTVGVIEHGLFLGLADEVLLGSADGTVEARTREEQRQA